MPKAWEVGTAIVAITQVERLQMGVPSVRFLDERIQYYFKLAPLQ